MWQEMADLGRRLRASEDIRCLVVTGEGSSFSAGLDLVEGMAGMLARWSDRPADEESITAGLELARTFEWIPRLAFPSIAAVRGHAYGAGLQLALVCDFRIFAEGAQVGLTEARYGILPDMGAAFRLPRLVGESRARELILLGEVVGASEAARIGLAHQVVADVDLEAAVEALAERLANQPPLALRGARRAIEAGWAGGAEASCRAAVEGQIACITSADFAEAQRAHAERRAPEWQGR